MEGVGCVGEAFGPVELGDLTNEVVYGAIPSTGCFKAAGHCVRIFVRTEAYFKLNRAEAAGVH